MFWLGTIIGLILGASISLFLYACIVVGRNTDEYYTYNEDYYIEGMEES